VTETSPSPSASPSVPAESPPPARSPTAEPGSASAPNASPARREVADGSRRQLDPRIVSVRRIAGGVFIAVTTIGTFVPLVGFLLGGVLPPLGRLLALVGWVSLVALGGLWALVWPGLRYRHESYSVFSDGIEIRRGVIWRTVIHVPKTRVQHTDVSRGPLERTFGLSTLVVYTAGTEHASVSLSGLAEADGFAIRDHLIPRYGHDAV